MDQPLQPRRPLSTVTLTGWRLELRWWLLTAMLLLGVLAAGGFALGIHRAYDGWGTSDEAREWHSFALETWLAPVLAPALTALAAWWARRGGFPRALLAGVLGPVTFVVFVAAMISVHSG